MTHITIDLDYQFIDNYNYFYKLTKDEEFINFIKMFLISGKEHIVVDSHHKIVPFLNTRSIDKIINVDYHSDIVHEDSLDSYGLKTKTRFNEGTWANFVDDRKQMDFIWRYPNKEYIKYGICDEYPKPWIPKLMGYKSVRKYEKLPKINMKDIDSYSICYSPNWTRKEAIRDIKKLIKSY